MSSINISFFGNFASKQIPYVIHQIFLFWKYGINVLLMSLISISFLGNSHPKSIFYVIHQIFLFWKFSSKMGSLCHLSEFSFLESQDQNVLLMSSIKISVFGILATKYIAYVIHHNFPFWQSQPKMGVPHRPSKFPFLEIPTQNGLLMSSIKISFFGNITSKSVTYVIHQIFLFQ